MPKCTQKCQQIFFQALDGQLEQDLTQFEVLKLCDYSTGCDEIGYYFATEADTMIDIVYEVDLNKD